MININIDLEHHVRKTLDCLIAAACVAADAPLLQAHRNFDLLAGCTPLRIHAVPA